MKLTTVMGLFLGAIALPLAGCGATILGGGDGTSRSDDQGNDDGNGGGNGGSGPSSSGPAASNGQAVTAVAIASQSLPAEPPYPEGFSYSLFLSPDSDALVIFFTTDAGQTCSSPYLPASPTTTSWEWFLVIAADALKPGPVYSTDVMSYVLSEAPGVPPSGGGGGGGGPDDESLVLEIVSIDATSITVTLPGPMSLSPAASATFQGTYTIPRC
jgi:hypothetical protein